MDPRDRFLIPHHQRRLACCAHLPLARQCQCAEHLCAVARAQGRFQLLLIAGVWLARLQQQANAP